MAYGFKTGGRQKGALNKVTLQIREKLQEIFYGELDSGRLQSAINALPEKEYVAAMMKLNPYVTPRANNGNSMVEPLAPQQAANTGGQVDAEEPATGEDEQPEQQPAGALPAITWRELKRLRREPGMTDEKFNRIIRERVEGKPSPAVRATP